MPSNIEIKARLADPGRARELAERLAKTPPTVLQQHDTFFRCSGGRLKLRRLSPTEGELIAYSRPDTREAKRSDYAIFKTGSPGILETVLSAALGVEIVVSKTRLLYLVGQTRIHLDSVAGLGSFVEIEVVLQEGQPAADGEKIAREFIQALEICEEDLVEGAYADLLKSQSS